MELATNTATADYKIRKAKGGKGDERLVS